MLLTTTSRYAQPGTAVPSGMLPGNLQNGQINSLQTFAYSLADINVCAIDRPQGPTLKNVGQIGLKQQ